MLEHELEKIKTETGYPLWDFSISARERWHWWYSFLMH